MTNGGFPYNEKDIEEEDNKKIYRMQKWTYKQLSAEIKSNDKRLEKHDNRIQDLEEFCWGVEAKTGYKYRIENILIQVAITIITAGMMIIGLWELV